MKYLIAILMMISFNVNAQESCDQTCKDIQQDVNTPVPKALEGAEIIVRTKDGKETKMSANDFKVVKRKQQFKVTERVVVKMKSMPPEDIAVDRAMLERYIESSEARNRKNILMLGVSYDYTDLDMSVNGNTVKLYSQKGPVFDISYLRRNILDSRFGLGLGINTNGAPRGFVGVEF